MIEYDFREPLIEECKGCGWAEGDFCRIALSPKSQWRYGKCLWKFLEDIHSNKVRSYDALSEIGYEGQENLISGGN